MGSRLLSLLTITAVLVIGEALSALRLYLYDLILGLKWMMTLAGARRPAQRGQNKREAIMCRVQSKRQTWTFELQPSLTASLFNIYDARLN